MLFLHFQQRRMKQKGQRMQLKKHTKMHGMVSIWLLYKKTGLILTFVMLNIFYVLHSSPIFIMFTCSITVASMYFHSGSTVFSKRINSG